MDDKDNILVADSGNSRIQKFTSGGTFIAATPDNLGLKGPAGIAIHPHSKKLYVADGHNHCIKILKPDLTLVVLAAMAMMMDSSHIPMMWHLTAKGMCM